ncbi:Uncharacterized protein HZ326_31713 [Fusarium oxysporum f. sp. albedinis]|nr:Uncharacterized protein HZ326_31713 [Fusarium oxysporum f. sp. albedinis]
MSTQSLLARLQNLNGSESTLPVYLVKCMIAVFSASDVAPLRLSQSSALSIIACIPLRLLPSPTVQNHPLLELILLTHFKPSRVDYRQGVELI